MQQVKPNYLELKATDKDTVQRFYASAFAFTFKDYGPGYFAVEGGACDVGFAVGAEPSAPMPVLETADLEASLAAVEAAGGRIVKEPFAYPGGRRFELEDPSGNRIGVYQKDR